MDSEQIISMKTRRERRPYSEQFKAQVIHACNQPGASIAAIAQAYDINTNVLHRWRREHAREGRYAEPVFMPLTVLAAAATSEPAENASVPFSLAAAAPVSDHKELSASDIQIECVRGQSKVTIRWPLSAAADCGTWITELRQLGPFFLIFRFESALRSMG